jgi:hypothetical protein
MNKMTQTEIQKHLEDPYNRLRYCYEFISEDEDMNRKCYKRIYHYLSTLSDTEYHYWLSIKVTHL